MKRKDNMPAFVYWGLWGIKSRGAARGFMWSTLALAFCCFLFGFVHPKAFLWMFIFFGAAAWYWYATRWADKNSSWNDK
jgi:hypothetical protein